MASVVDGGGAAPSRRRSVNGIDQGNDDGWAVEISSPQGERCPFCIGLRTMSRGAGVKSLWHTQNGGWLLSSGGLCSSLSEPLSSNKLSLVLSRYAVT